MVKLTLSEGLVPQGGPLGKEAELPEVPRTLVLRPWVVVLGAVVLGAALKAGACRWRDLNLGSSATWATAARVLKCGPASVEVTM